MNITVIDCSTSPYYKPKTENAVMIRIGDELNEYHLPKINESLYKEVHTFQFYDIVPKPGLPSNWNYFNKTDGERLLSIFESLEGNGIEEVIVHCFAGVSRSPAVAISLAWHLKQEESIPEILKLAVPNKQVLKVMAKLIGVYNENRDFIHNVSIFQDEEDEDARDSDIIF